MPKRIRTVACFMVTLALGACEEPNYTDDTEPVPDGAVPAPRADETLAPGAAEETGATVDTTGAAGAAMDTASTP